MCVAPFSPTTSMYIADSFLQFVLSKHPGGHEPAAASGLEKAYCFLTTAGLPNGEGPEKGPAPPLQDECHQKCLYLIKCLKERYYSFPALSGRGSWWTALQQHRAAEFVSDSADLQVPAEQSGVASSCINRNSGRN